MDLKAKEGSHTHTQKEAQKAILDGLLLVEATTVSDTGSIEAGRARVNGFASRKCLSFIRRPEPRGEIAPRARRMLGELGELGESAAASGVGGRKESGAPFPEGRSFSSSAGNGGRGSLLEAVTTTDPGAGRVVTVAGTTAGSIWLASR